MPHSPQVPTHQSSGEGDTLSALSAPSEVESYVCDTAITKVVWAGWVMVMRHVQEAARFAQQVLLDMRSVTDTDSLGSRSDNPESVRDRPDNVFIEANSEDSVVIEDFAFSKQQNFFNIPPDCKLPLSITNLSVCAPPRGDEESSDQLTPVITPVGDATFFPHLAEPAPAPASLSLIEEVTEHSTCSTVRSSSSITRRNASNSTPTSVRTATSHVPRIVKPMSPRESPRDSTKSLRPRLRALDSTLPSKSQPSTPREDEPTSEGKERFAKARPRLVGRRFLRSSPPREMKPHQDPRPMADQPLHTKYARCL